MNKLNEIQCEKASRCDCPIVNELKAKIKAQRHELKLQAKYREEDGFARQMLDKNACQRKVDDYKAKIREYEDLLFSDEMRVLLRYGYKNPSSIGLDNIGAVATLYRMKDERL